MMPSNMVYTWSHKSYPIKPDVVAGVIECVASKNDGVCRPDDLVEASRHRNSQTHRLFTWDNNVAAHKWRRHEARNVINSLVVTITVGDEDITAPAFCSVGGSADENGEASEKGYRHVTVVVADPVMRKEALDEVMAKLQALRIRHAAIEALSPVWEVIDRIAA